jgi:hypothetical protein
MQQTIIKSDVDATASQTLPTAAVMELLSGAAITEAVVGDAEQAMLAYPQAPCPVHHRFGPGIYFREVRMPAGILAIGHIQNFEHVNIFLQGRVTVLLDDGTQQELRAPMFFIGKPGRKIGYVHEDVVWINAYATNETDIGKLEAHFLSKSDGWLTHADAALAHAELRHQPDRNDFMAALSELGISADTVHAQSVNEADQCEMPHDISCRIKVGASPIEGRGLFATADIAQGEHIAPARINGLRTPAGRYTNHAKQPNARMAGDDQGNIHLIALRPISGCMGGRDGEEITVDYRQSVAEARRINEGN